MKLKLDENLGQSCVQLCRDAGHDVATVYQQKLNGAEDATVAEACRAESRCLVTLDLDFSNPLRFKPSAHAGIAVLRVPPKSSLTVVHELIRTFLKGLDGESIQGRLWSIEIGRIRVYQEDTQQD